MVSAELIVIILNVICTIVVTFLGTLKLIRKFSIKSKWGVCNCESGDEDIIKYIVDATHIFKNGGEHHHGIAHLDSALNIFRRRGSYV